MKLAIDIGHNCNPDIGASGIKSEDKLTMELGTKLITKLESLEFNVINVLPKRASSVLESLVQRVATANAARANAYISLHFNAYNFSANGTEIFAISNDGRAMAKPILDNICDLKFFNRGIKHGGHLYVVRNTIMPAVLIECCFCDSEKDMSIYNADTMCNAIADGLVKGLIF